MRVLVCGSRTWTDPDPIVAILNGLDSQCHDDFITIIEGGARGADRIAATWALERENPGLHTFPADWRKHGRAAGHIRNARMLVEGEPDLVIAFSDQPITPGTANMIEQAEFARVPVWIIGHGREG